MNYTHLGVGPSVSLERLPIRVVISGSKVPSVKLKMYISILLDITVFTKTIFVANVKKDSTPLEKTTSVSGLTSTSEVKWIPFHLVTRRNEGRIPDQENLALFPFLSFGVPVFLFRNFFFVVYWNIFRTPTLVMSIFLIQCNTNI